MRARSRLRNWLFSGPKKHLLLRELLLRRPHESLSRTDLALGSNQHPKARLDKTLGPLIQAGLVTVRDGRYQVDQSHSMARPLRDLLEALDTLPDEELQR